MKNKELKNSLIKILVISLLVLAVGWAFLYNSDRHEKLVYKDHLEDLAFSIDGQEVTFAQLGYYVLLEERKVEEEALLFNPDNTKDYWNTHANGVFIQVLAKDTMMDMAVHDYLMYNLAVKDGYYLEKEDLKNLENYKTDFWEDLFDEQIKKNPVDKDIVDEGIRIAAYGQRYSEILAQKASKDAAAYAFDGYYYKQMLKEHDVKINKKLWDRFVAGDNTLTHTKVSYSQAIKKEDKDEN